MKRNIEIAAAGSVLLAFVAGLAAPPDAVQGDLQRIMYVHVPSAWLAYLAFGVTLVGSIAYLVTRRLRWDRLAASSAEVGVVFTGLALATGSIWGKPVWGVWWTWDARLVLTAAMFFVYLAYLALRRSIEGAERRARRSAVFGIVAALQIPVVHFSVVWWRGLHQPPTVLRPDNPQIDAPLLFALLMAVFAFTLVYVALVGRRMDLAAAEDLLNDAPRPDEDVAGAAVTAPQVGGAAR
ncbi:MAG: cytochrome C biogenesis protein [Actinobacteria bacterium RBG_16_67_15]|nr:MAG: cytochrome C biogenesis protein [Actinobacteria bacterium RBG_16_67_15]